MKKLRKTLIEAHKKCNFLNTAYNEYLNQKDDRKSIGREIAFLHNKGHIDALAEFSHLSNDSKTSDFFIIRNIFEDVLPELNTPVCQVMACVDHLITEAGNDMTAGILLTPFIKYCENKPTRPHEVINIVEKDCNKWINFILPAIVAGSNSDLSEYLSIALSYAYHKNIEVRIRTILAFERINYNNELSAINKVLTILEQIIQSEIDDRLISFAIKSVFSFYKLNNDIERKVIEIIKKALVNNGPFLLHSISEIFNYNKDNISQEFQDILLNSLKNVDPQNKRTIDNIDDIIVYLIKINQDEKVFFLLEYLLVKNNNVLSIEVFDSFIRYLFVNNRQTLNTLVTRWFLSFNISLCRAVMDIIQSGHGADIILHADLNLFTINLSKKYLYIVRKAIGWLFMNPVSCTSFIISIIDVTSDEEIEQITELLFDPLLISYPGKVKEYIEKTMSDQSEKVKTALNNALVMLRDYHEGLKAVEEIRELLPSQDQRKTFSRINQRRMSVCFKEAQKNSILDQIFTKSVLLYGRKIINYAYGSNNEIKRFEAPMQSISHSIEFPSLEYMDPHGMEQIITLFRVEGCKK